MDSAALGYGHAWLTEHHFVDDGYSPSLLPIATGIAARTSRIRIGAFLVLLPLHNPVRIAEDTAAVDIMSNGRFELGVGLGYRRKEFDDQGIPHTERGVRLEEGIALVQRCCSALRSVSTASSAICAISGFRPSRCNGRAHRSGWARSHPRPASVRPKMPEPCSAITSCGAA